MVRVVIAFVVLNLTGVVLFSGYLYRQSEVFQTAVAIHQPLEDYWARVADPKAWPEALPVLFASVELDTSDGLWVVQDQWGEEDRLDVGVFDEAHQIQVEGRRHKWSFRLVTDPVDGEKTRILFYDVWPKDLGPLDWFFYKMTLKNGLGRVNLSL